MAADESTNDADDEVGDASTPEKFALSDAYSFSDGPLNAAPAETPKDAEWDDGSVPTENDGRSGLQTGFDPRDAPTQLVQRGGEVVNKWEHLNQLN